jgi:RNA-binding protein
MGEYTAILRICASFISERPSGVPQRKRSDLPGRFPYFGAMVSLTNAHMRVLKAQAQRLKATLKVGKEGLSPQFLAALDDALKHRELVKVKFDDFKEQKKELAPQLAEKSGSRLVTRVGNVVVLFRPKPAEPQPG